jgi:16S rRNA (cytosine967-C5)-methyltransferase
MTPEGRIGALIDLLEEVAKGGAADAAASAFFRGRRYIGSKDRGWIAVRLYAVLRRRARLDWWIDRVLERPEGAPQPAARHRVIADLMLTEGWPIERVLGVFDGDKHHPAPPSRAERTLLEALKRQPLEHPDQPAWVRRELPEWITPELERLFQGDEAELAALNEPAPLDLRVNRLGGSREEAIAQLAEAGIEAVATPLSPLGLRVTGRPALSRSAAFQAGRVEVQDEGSQLVALLAGAKPGYAVLDYCAGAGGKTLALAAEMGNKGRLIACDVSAKRLERAVIRLRRAGVHNVERRALGPDSAQWLKRQAGRFDRVLVDAPCSGTGTWRRNPDMKWKIGPRDLSELTRLQAEILATASRLVKPGGRLVYATCSLLPVENEETVQRFLADHPDFVVRPVSEIWAEDVGGDCPVPGPYLRLTPARHHTDGFFAAVLERPGVVLAAA